MIHRMIEQDVERMRTKAWKLYWELMGESVHYTLTVHQSQTLKFCTESFNELSERLVEDNKPTKFLRRSASDPES